TFIRQPMVRYTRGRLQVALENPDATIQGNVNTGQAGGFVDQSELPDLTAKMQLVASDRTLLTLAGLVRQIDAGNSADTGDDTAMGYGVSLSGRQKFGMDDIRFQFNFGDGIGRYLGLNAARGAVLDDNGELETIQAMGGYVAYRHFWSQRWRSNIALGYFSADNETRFSGEAVTETISSAQANLLYSPVTAFTIGGELMFHQRELENGADGHQTRLQFSAKYAF
ncbi:MAG: porin, partial [Proteobacteria bacterium]|nr:porin [Pseudomonadota bacterium]